MRKWLKVLRVGIGWTQQEAGQRLGISQTMYSAIENGTRKKELSLKLMEDISVVFGVSYEEIVKYEKGALNE